MMNTILTAREKALTVKLLAVKNQYDELLSHAEEVCAYQQAELEVAEMEKNNLGVIIEKKDQEKKAVKTTVRRLRTTTDYMLQAVLDTPTEQQHDYGVGYDRNYKDIVWSFLHKFNPNWNESIRRKAFYDLYKIINKATGSFEEEWNMFLKFVKENKMKAPNAPRYDWHRLDMISCNNYWRALSAWAMTKYEEQKLEEANKND